MHVLVQGVVFHLSSLAIFTLVYFLLYDNNFDNIVQGDSKPIPINDQFMDCFYFSTTVAAGVGLTSLQPNTNMAKFIICIQQFLMIIANIFILYFSFTKKS